MKTRHGFVSNSSSSSFVIKKVFLTTLQIWAIKNHVKVATEAELNLGPIRDDDAWKIDETEDELSVHVSMDNFDMRHFFEEIGIPSRFIEIGGYHDY